MKIGKKKFFKFATVGAAGALMSISLTACGSSASFKSSIQLVVSDNGSTLADQSFSESSYNGIRQFFNSIGIDDVPEANSSLLKDNNGVWKRPGKDDDSRIAAYRNAVNQGTEIVVATGYNQQTALQMITSQNEDNKANAEFFKNTGFVFVDGAMESGSSSTYNSNPFNVSSVSFRADDGSFLTGISTAVFLNLYQDYFKKDGKLGVSAFVGIPLPSTKNFFNGFRLGIHYWNKILQPLIPTVDGTKTTLPVHWVSSGNNYSIDNFVSGSFEANNTNVSTLVKGMRQNGANAIFPIAGPQTSLAVSLVSSETADKYAKSVVIGVDTAQEKITSLEKDLPNNNGIQGSEVGSGKIVQFSSIKNLQTATYGILNAITSGANNSSSQAVNGYYGLGWNNVGTLENAGVGVSDAGLQYLINPNWTTWFTENDSSLSTDPFEKITLNDLLKNHVAKSLTTSDPVVSEYNKLLSGEFKTNITDISTGTNSLSSYAKIRIDKADGYNGPTQNGEWKIYNNLENGNNNFLSLNLSKYIPAITPSSEITVEYPVASSTASYVGISGELSFTKEEMFFEKK